MIFFEYTTRHIKALSQAHISLGKIKKSMLSEQNPKLKRVK
jgi:hypothetical protein